MPEFVIANPHARVFEEGGVTWLVSGSDPAFLESTVIRAAGKGLSVDEVLRELCRKAEEGTFAAIEPCGEGRARTILCKSLSSTFDLYYRKQGESIQVLDHFRNAVAAIPPGERVPDEGAFADHLLFAYQYLMGAHTFLQGVSKLTPGERVEIGPGGEFSSSRLESLGLPEPGTGPGVGEVLDRLDRIVEERVSAYRSNFGEPAVLLSGGVDSTLVLSYLEKGTRAITVGTNTPEYAFEMDYARLSARLLEADHLCSILDESAYRSLAGDLVDELGQPSDIAFFQPMAFHFAFQQPHDLFLSGETVDALFGFNKLARLFNDEALSGEERQRLDREAESEEGFASLYGLSPDFETVRALLGETRVRERLKKRLDFALRCCPGLCERKIGTRREAHAEIVSFFTGFGHIKEYIGRTRQQAFCQGRTVLTPFACRSVLDLAMSIPMPERILRDGVVKHVAKSLLARRVPLYPVFTPKGGSDVPRTRFLQEGPLKDIFHGQDLPCFWPEEKKDILLYPRRESSYLAMNALSYSFWQNRVLKNPDLGEVPGTRTFTVPVGRKI